MPTCPECKGKYKRRKGGTCPGCGTRVELYRQNGKTIWVTETPSTKKLVSKLEQYIRRQLPAFTFGNWRDDSCRREFAMAKILLERCGNNQHLAEMVIDAYFTGALYPPKSIAGVIGKQFQYALALAKKELEKVEASEKATEERAGNLEESELDVRFAL